MLSSSMFVCAEPRSVYTVYPEFRGELRSSIPTQSESANIQPFRSGPHYGWQKRPSSNLFRMNTCKSVSKQMTLTPCRMNTYEKHRGGGSLIINQTPDGEHGSRLFRFFASPLGFCYLPHRN